MRRTFVLSLIILICSCSRESDSQELSPHQISFGISISSEITNQTRKGTIASTSFDGHDVLLFGTGALHENHDWHSGTKIMNALPGKLQSQTDNSYLIEHAPRYYLHDERFYYSFRIVYPYNLQKGVDISIDPQTQKPHIKVDISKQADLLIAAVDKVRKSKQSIALDFKHLLTQVAFTIKKDPNLLADIYLNKITVYGYHNAEVSYPNTEFDQQSYSTPGIIDVFRSGISLFPIRTVDQEVAHVLLLPQTEDGSNRYTFVVELSDGRTGTFYLPYHNGWEAGKRYCYHLNVLPQRINIELNPQIESWKWDGIIY